MYGSSHHNQRIEVRVKLIEGFNIEITIAQLRYSFEKKIVVSIVGDIISIIEAFLNFLLVSCVKVSVDKVSVVYLQDKQFLSNVCEVVYRRQ